MPTDGKTIGVWIADDDPLLAQFDAQFDTSEDGDNSRSSAIKDAMRLAVATDQTLREVGCETDSVGVKRHFVQQALFRDLECDD